MRKGCAALAIDGRNPCGAHGYAAAPQLGSAQNTALRVCYRFGGQDCVIRAWVFATARAERRLLAARSSGGGLKTECCAAVIMTDRSVII